MENKQRIKLLSAYRRTREFTNTNPVGEATGRTYIPLPQSLRDDGADAEGVAGFVKLFERMLNASPVVVRSGELIIGDYYFLLPYEIIPMSPPYDYQAFSKRGALPVPPSGHTVVNLERGLVLGWQGVLDHIKHCRATIPSDTAASAYLDGAEKVVALIQARIRHYGFEAARMAAATHDTEKTAELRAIAERCTRLTTAPPESFHDALQWYFFFVTFERSTSSGMGSVRLDQVFYPYFQRDKAHGILDDARAQLLVQTLLLKEVLFCSVGGVTASGKDATNPLSHLILAAYDGIGGPSNLSVRWHAELDATLQTKALDILSRHKTGVPSLVNDDVIVPSLVHFGFTEAQARNYCFAGCFWYVVPGKEYPYHDLTGVSGVRALRRAIEEVSATGKGTFDAVWQAYCHYMTDAVAALVQAYDIIDPWLSEHYPEMVVSLLMDNCLERGRDVNAGGADCSLMTVLYVGLANVVDSIYALKQRVYEEQRTTLNEVMMALDSNFAGYEPLRQLMQSAPKYGNGHMGVDQLAVMVAEHFKSTLSSFRNSKGFALRPAFYSWHRHTFEGSESGATPDGRLAGMPLAHGGNPSHGCAKEGVTAAIQSMTMIKYTDTAGCPLHIHLYESDEGLRRNIIESLVRTAFDKGAVHMIINVVDGHILWDAIEHPDCFADLTIRVTGYSARFIQLQRKYQEEIASRNSY